MLNLNTWETWLFNMASNELTKIENQGINIAAETIHGSGDNYEKNHIANNSIGGADIANGAIT
jgi:hypothetical protein